jgi:AAA+ ATPase superfamily predicted ATPase
MPFFDRPIERPEDLFDREREFKDLREALATRAITVVVGFRRVGKTSLVKAATHDLPRVYVDARKFEPSQYVTYEAFLEELRRGLSGFMSLDRRIADYLKAVKGVRLLEVGVEFSFGRSRPLLTTILEALDRWARDRGKRVAFIIDEAQELIKMKGYSIAPAIAYAYDNLSGISFVLAGSKVGLLYRFLKVRDPASPLYGRYMERVELKPLSREESMEFLRRGFEGRGVRVGEAFLEAAAERLGGIVGWLSYLGLRALSKGEASPSIVNEVVEEASKMAASEFCNFVNAMGSRRYVEILKALGDEGATWSQVKRYLEVRCGARIYDSELARLLKNLMDNGFVEKRGEVYAIPDPILRHASKTIRC